MSKLADDAGVVAQSEVVKHAKNAEADKPSPKRIKQLKPMWGFIKPYRAHVIAAMIALIFTAAVTLSIGQGIRYIIDAGFSETASQAMSQGARGAEVFDQAIGFFVIMVIALAGGTFTRFYLVSWLGERVVADIRKAVFSHLIRLHPGFFDTQASGEIQSRITTDTALLQTVIGSSVSLALRNVLMMIGGLIMMFISNPKLSSIVLIAVPLTIGPIIFFGRRVRRLSRSSQDEVANVGAYVSEALQNIKVVQAFNHQGIDQRQFSDAADKAFSVAVKRISQRAILAAVAIVLILGAVGAMVWVGGHDVLTGQTSAGELTAFIFYALMVAMALAMISEVYGEIQRAAGASERLLELLYSPNDISEPENPVVLADHIPGEMCFKQVGFSYQSRPDYKAIDGLDVTIKAGSTVALVGASGAGKSTLFDLILRFYDVDAGSIELEGVDIRQLGTQGLRDHMAIVPQQPVLFSGTIMDNIRYGKPQASDAEVQQAAIAAYADEFIQRLEFGYESEVGESGVRLSGGQRQRIAIARAILKDPAILLLDEATSALDAESEFRVQQALEVLMQGRTTIIIAHRLATVLKADEILVLESGRLVDRGSHHQLLKSSELYSRWASLQFDLANLEAS